MFMLKQGFSVGIAAIALLSTQAPILARGISTLTPSHPSLRLAQQTIPTQRVQFNPGTTSATIQASIKGYQTVDYILNVRQGQTMNVSMATKHGATYFNILEPGQRDVAIFNGSVNGNQFEGVVKKSGDYRIRIYMMRSAARRNEVANYRLETIVSGNDGGDALVPGTNYNATGNVSCSMGGGQPTASCRFGVVRKGNGNGTVTVTKPDGRTRSIFFENGKATGYDRSQADRGSFSASKQSDLNIIRIGQERYEIPDAVIFGG
ncbi:hypothetical protein [Pseudanabaena sp. PCC 6802]|uniref:hypothetical protein n=1 Tax=Pseudanabaena sp. PCC 6802 TaxID=118173 RepID=UPI00034515D3|nr:hypothetical protein [Pseudanabaena sp. PCC 6802]